MDCAGEGVFLQGKGENRAGETSTNDGDPSLRAKLAVDFFFQAQEPRLRYQTRISALREDISAQSNGVY
jgi:hypothetical protein